MVNHLSIQKLLNSDSGVEIFLAINKKIKIIISDIIRADMLRSGGSNSRSSLGLPFPFLSLRIKVRRTYLTCHGRIYNKGTLNRHKNSLLHHSAVRCNSWLTSLGQWCVATSITDGGRTDLGTNASTEENKLNMTLSAITIIIIIVTS